MNALDDAMRKIDARKEAAARVNAKYRELVRDFLDRMNAIGNPGTSSKDGTNAWTLWWMGYRYPADIAGSSNLPDAGSYILLTPDAQASALGVGYKWEVIARFDFATYDPGLLFYEALSMSMAELLRNSAGILAEQRAQERREAEHAAREAARPVATFQKLTRLIPAKASLGEFRFVPMRARELAILLSGRPARQFHMDRYQGGGFLHKSRFHGWQIWTGPDRSAHDAMNHSYPSLYLTIGGELLKATESHGYSGSGTIFEKSLGTEALVDADTCRSVLCMGTRS